MAVKTAQQFVTYINAALKWKEKNPKLSIFKRGIDKFAEVWEEKYKPIRDKYNAKLKTIQSDVEDLRVFHADKDANGNVICLTETETTPQGNVIVRETNTPKTHKPENINALRKAIQAKNEELNTFDQELLKIEIEFEPMYVSEFPGDLTEPELQAFSGFIIDPKVLEQVEVEFEANGQVS